MPLKLTNLREHLAPEAQFPRTPLLKLSQKGPSSFELKPQKQAKQVEKAPFSLLEANCKGVSAPPQTLFGPFL
jgi:hypothetical protein